MRVLLISANRATGLAAPFPLGAAFVAGALRKCGHTVMVFDCMFLEDWKPALRAALHDFRPDAVGLSIRNIDNQDMGAPVFYLDGYREIIPEIRAQSGAPVILGGAGFNIHPSGCLRFLGADYGIFGEGEAAFPALLDALRDGDFGKVPGAVWKKEDRIIVSSPRYLGGANRWATPAYDDFDIAAYHDARTEIPGCISVQNKRGCHMKCIYCSTPLLEGVKCRSRDLRETVSEMASLNREKGVRRFYIADNVFNFPLSEAKAFCREILAQGLKVSWQAILNPAFGDEELFELMGKAGCGFVSLGNETGHELMLKSLRKGFTLKNAAKAARLARANGMRFGCFLLFGGPGETRDTVERSMEFVEGLSPDLVSLKAGIRIYPGTQLEVIARAEGVINDSEDLLYPAFYLSPAVREWIRGSMADAARDRGNWKV